MINNKETLNYIENYFNSIKNNLPTNSVFVSAYKYNAKTNHNTDDEPLSINDDIIVYYDSGSKSSNSSFRISNSAIIIHLRNKKLNELGI